MEQSVGAEGWGEESNSSRFWADYEIECGGGGILLGDTSAGVAKEVKRQQC